MFFILIDHSFSFFGLQIITFLRRNVNKYNYDRIQIVRENIRTLKVFIVKSDNI